MSVKKALEHLEAANYAGYFEVMDNLVPKNLLAPYNTLKGQFMAGQTPFDFHQKLTVFAKAIEKTKTKTHSNSSNISGDGNINIQGISNSTITVGDGAKKIKPKILFLSANPTDSGRLQTDKEYRLISERMRNNQHYELLKPELALTVENLIIAMNQKPEIVHFSGHGQQTGIIISTGLNESQVMSERALKRLFKQHKKNTKLVLLNACYSEPIAETLSNLGIYVIGMNDAAADLAAIDFAQGLYIGLGEGKNVETAFDDAMIVIETKHPNFADLPKVWYKGELLDL